MTSPPSSSVDIIRRELGTLLTLPRSQAHAMSAAYYTCPDFLALERAEFFCKKWVCLGHVGEIPDPGSYFVTNLAGEELLVVRDKQGTVRVLSNVCRHRGNLLATGAGSVKSFVCSYHAWSYGLDGALQAAPLIPESPHFDKHNCRLPQFRCDIWHGFIFVNLEGNAPPLTPTLTAIEPHIENYCPDERQFLYGEEDAWRTNWKCVVENFMEGYHLSPTHRATLHEITPTKLCEKLPNEAAFTGYRANFSPAYFNRCIGNPRLTEKERRSDVFYCIYPSFVVGFSPDNTLYMCLRPLTVDSVGIRWGITGNPAALDRPRLEEFVALCKAFSKEDRTVLEQVQRGLSGRYYSPGPLAPDNYEGTIWDILQYAARSLGTPS